jgi:serine/threonine-protein kinase RsbW
VSSDSSANGGAPSGGLRPIASRAYTPRPARPANSQDRHEARIEGLTVALRTLRQGAAALKAENHELRAEVEELRTSARGDDRSPREFGQLATVALPAGSRAPGAARQVLRHCLPRLITARILTDTQLLVSELVTNSVRHAELVEGDTVAVRIYVAADRVRLEVENPGTAGVVARREPDPSPGGGFGLELLELIATRWGVNRERSTTVWFEMARA